MPHVSSFGERRSTARVTLALMLACTRYWSGVAGVVKRELRRWEVEAQLIGDPVLRRLALEKLRDEGFTAEAAAMLATSAPRARRKSAVQAIVALEVMYDYLDGLSELPSSDPLGDGERLFATFTGAFDGDGARAGSARSTGDSAYLRDLAGVVSGSLARLPAANAIRDVARAGAGRSAQAQTRMHAAPTLGDAQLERWARRQAQTTALEWREALAGAASSVIALYALIAAAADERTTPAEAAALDAAYLSISALSTMLDSLVDHQADASAGAERFIEHYGDDDAVADALVRQAHRAIAQAHRLPDDAHHLAMLAGVVAFYTSETRARGGLTQATVAPLHEELGRLIAPALAVMRIWRMVKELRERAPRTARIVSGVKARLALKRKGR
jgi:tetraprenyl-beta-curcumene synthase